MARGSSSGVAVADSRDWAAFGFLTITALCWLGNTVFVRALHEEIAPAGIAFWCTVLTVAVMLPFVYPKLRAQLFLLRRHGWLIFVIGIAQFTTGQAMLYLGVETTIAVNAGLILGAQPAVTVIFTWLLLGDRLSGAQFAGVIVALAGIGAIILRGDAGSLGSLTLVIGDLWVGVAVISWAFYAPLLKRLPRELDPFVVVIAATFCGGVGLAPFYAGETFLLGVHTEATWETLAIVGYVGFFGTILGVVCWNLGIARIGPNRAATFLYLIPVFTVVFGVAALGETFRFHHVLGTVLVFAGVAITNTAARARAAP